jgi:hypothetical protein
MPWVVAITSAIFTGFLAYKSLGFYYRFRYQLKTASRDWMAIWVDTIFLIWVLSLGSAPTFVLALAYPEGDFYPSVVAVAIFWVFIIRAYLLFKKEHPKMYEALWRSQDESNKGS